jgi:metal-responsive CopG/Arc/MetJ family transcriptional regulator
MKTIAITIDEETLASVDRLSRGRDRSKHIRQAVREYVERLELQAQLAREAEVVRVHRHRLARQARALVRAQGRS